MRRPQNLEEAKAIYREEKAKVTGSVSALVGSRWLLAIAATFAIAFATNLVFAPERLPHVGGLSVAQVGLPPVDFGFLGEQAKQARQAAIREGVPGEIEARLQENAAPAPLINALGLGLTLLVLGLNLVVMTKRRAFTRG